MEFGVGSLSVMVSMPVPLFLEHLAESLALPQPQQIAADERLSLAVDLYATSFGKRADVPKLAVWRPL
jgi:hypothetical protein